MNKLELLVIHCTATLAGHEISSDQIRRWHMGAKRNKDGTVTYKGKNYANEASLPNEKLGGVIARKTQGRGWGQVGYADMMHLNGNIETLVPYNDNDTIEPWEITNGSLGVNGKARHIVYVGGLDRNTKKSADTRTQQQKDMLATYVNETIAEHPEIKICGHRDVNKTECPGFNVAEWLRSIGVEEKNIYVNP